MSSKKKAEGKTPVEERPEQMLGDGGIGAEQDAKGSSREDGGSENGTQTNLADLYEKMSRILRESLEKTGTLTEEVFERSLKEARELSSRMKEHYGEDISKVSEYIRRDWHEAIRFTRTQTRRSFNLDRLQAGLLDVISTLAKSAGEQLGNFAEKINHRLTYKTGEIAGAGTLECLECHQTLLFEQASRIPPCPKCRNTTFRRSF